jgi:hypothetical protein
LKNEGGGVTKLKNKKIKDLFYKALVTVECPLAYFVKLGVI